MCFRCWVVRCVLLFIRLVCCDDAIFSRDIHTHAPLASQTGTLLDITSLLKTAPGVPVGACVFNPSVMPYKLNTYIVFSRIYEAKNESLKCVDGRLRCKFNVEGCTVQPVESDSQHRHSWMDGGVNVLT